MRVELVSRLGDHTEAEVILGRLEWADPRADLPTRMAAAAVVGLAFGPRQDRDRYTARLAVGLGQVTRQRPGFCSSAASAAVRC